MAFIGSEALRSGRLTRGQLRWNYTAVHPNVYIPRGTPRTEAVNTRAAAIWVPDGVVTDRAAAAVHGARYVDDDTPIELIGRNRRPQPGVIVRSERIAQDEITEVSGLKVGTPVRAALDISRHLPRVPRWHTSTHSPRRRDCTPRMWFASLSDTRAPGACGRSVSWCRFWTPARSRRGSPGCDCW